jgi:hypothetical protein
MSSMSDLDIDVRQAERDGIDHFPTRVYADPINSDRRVWAIFDVRAASESEHGIAFVRDEGRGGNLTFEHAWQAHFHITLELGGKGI